MFDEENLSIKPLKEAIFRFTYDGWKQHPVVITLTNHEIIVKRGSQSLFVVEDTSKLILNERFHYLILSRFFPLNDTARHSVRRRKYLDSLAHVYPELLNPAYYHLLMDKVLVPTNPTFHYTIKRIPISNATFRHLVEQFNNAGFWKLPFDIKPNDCEMADGYGFSIEANNGKKYQCVNIMGCPDDTTRITKACQELVKYAKADDKIQLTWEGKTEMLPAPDDTTNK